MGLLKKKPKPLPIEAVIIMLTALAGISWAGYSLVLDGKWWLLVLALLIPILYIVGGIIFVGWKDKTHQRQDKDTR